MKKFLSTLWIFFLVFCFLPLSAFAASDTYELDELGMSIEIPSDYVVFTRDVRSDDPNLSAYGVTKDELYSLMLERSVYLNAWDKDINYEIIVTMTASPLEDYNQLSDTTLSGLVSALETEYAAMGITLIRSDIYQHSQAKFAKIYISQPNNGETAYGLQYNTVYNGKAINITLQSYSGKRDASKETIIQIIVNSVHFDSEPQYSEPPAQTEAFTYTDKDSGLSFTVPANWVEAPLSDERDIIDAKFISNLEDGPIIFFTTEDLFPGLSETSKGKLLRSDIGNSVFSKSEIADALGCKASEVSTATIGDREYYYAEVVVTETTANGVTISVPMITYLRCENGYMYMFQFLGGTDSQSYSDFSALMNSLVYPWPNESDTGKDPWKQFNLVTILANLLVTVAVYSLPIIIYRFAIRKKPVEKKKAKRITIIYGIIAFILMSILIFAANGEGAAGGAILLWSLVNYRVLVGGEKKQKISPVSELERLGAASDPSQEDDLPAITFCHKCGNKLMPNSLFCNKCGARVPNKKGEAE